MISRYRIRIQETGVKLYKFKGNLGRVRPVKFGRYKYLN